MIYMGQNELDLTKICVVIPAYKPSKILLTYIEQLHETGFEDIIVVDDGSGEAYREIFRDVALKAILLLHEVNRGKGAALKTAYSWIRNNLPHIEGIITADSDGQHKAEDCKKLGESLCSGRDALYLGTRDFNLPNIPPKSRMGNKITSLTFKLLYGEYLPDTQTGLRAFKASRIPFMEGIKGDRYEYEMNVLIACARASIPFCTVPIETVYENNNEGSHFNPLLDSWRIYRVIFTNFFKFMASSVISMLVDQGLFNILNLLLFANGKAKLARFILISTIIARIISSLLNYMMNRKYVFSDAESRQHHSFYRYYLLCTGIMLASAGGTWCLSRVGLSSTIAKLVTDTVLYFASYRLQQQWVFKLGKA